MKVAYLAAKVINFFETCDSADTTKIIYSSDMFTLILSYYARIFTGLYTACMQSLNKKLLMFNVVLHICSYLFCKEYQLYVVHIKIKGSNPSFPLLLFFLCAGVGQGTVLRTTSRAEISTPKDKFGLLLTVLM